MSTAPEGAIKDTQGSWATVNPDQRGGVKIRLTYRNNDFGTLHYTRAQANELANAIRSLLTLGGEGQ